MSMPMAYCTPGAEVEKVLDVKRDEEGNPIVIIHENTISGKWHEYKFEKCLPQRGFIVKVKYPGDEAYSSDCVEHVEVKFEPGKDPERCLPTQLNLVKVANEAALAALKNQTAIEKGNQALVRDLRDGQVPHIDKTGRPKRGKMSGPEAEEFAKA